MKLLLAFTVIALLFFSCSKEKSDRLVGTVIQSAGCFPNTWAVAVENGDPQKHSFICKEAGPFATTYNCSNSVFIKNLPSQYAVAGKKIRFEVDKIEQFSCLSYSLAPYHVEAKNISEVR